MESLLQKSLSSELGDHLVFKKEASPIAERSSKLSLVPTLFTELKNVQLPLSLEEIASQRAQDSASAVLVSLSFGVFLSIEM